MEFIPAVSSSHLEVVDRCNLSTAIGTWYLTPFRPHLRFAYVAAETGPDGKKGATDSCAVPCMAHV